MSFFQLAPDWQEWLLLNMSRDCSSESLLAALGSHFPRELCERALDEGRVQLEQRKVASSEPLRPRFDVSANLIHDRDHDVSILLSLAAPQILLFQNLLTDAECDGLIAAGEERMEASTVVDDHSDLVVLNPHRSSSGAFFQRGESALVAGIERRLARLAQWPVERGEGLQLLRYQPGAEYRPHFDWFDPSLAGPRSHMVTGGQRVGTFVLYLSDVEAGGGTVFPELGLEIHPKKGAAVYFANLDAQGQPDAKTLHGGQPVVRGVKFIATKWLRERDYGTEP